MKVSQEEFTKLVGETLAKYRKHNNLTQIALAEKLNYSDKAVSKWEKGECLPDVYVLQEIAELYGITVNDILSPKHKIKTSSKKLSSFFIPALSCCIVWLVALLSYFVLSAIFEPNFKAWLVFIISIPINFIILLVFSCIYKQTPLQFISISFLIWSTIVAFHLVFAHHINNIFNVYFIGIPVQVITILWYIYRSIIKSKNKNK